jgi:crossover junction endodeoxyribonuclease RuvC
MTRILGLSVDYDPKLISVGACQVQLNLASPKPMPVISVWHELSKPDVDRTTEAASIRIGKIISALSSHITQADMVMLKSVTFNSAGTAARDLHWLWGRIVDCAVEHVVDLCVVPAAHTAAYVTGAGNSAKSTVLSAAKTRWPQVETVDSPEAADALILAAIGCRHLDKPIDQVPRVYWEKVIDPRAPRRQRKR